MATEVNGLMQHQMHCLSGPAVPPRNGSRARQLIVFLHGIGADGHDLIPLAPLYQQSFPGAYCVAPDAPFACDMSPFGRMWFSIADLPRVSRLEGARRAAPSLDQFLDDQLQSLGLADDRLLLVGFSQGAMMALYAGLRRQAAPAGIISHSGMILGAEALEEEVTARPPVLLTHGTVDDVLPVSCLDELDRVLSRVGITPETHRVDGLAHGLDQQTVTLALRFAMTVFAAPQCGD